MPAAQIEHERNVVWLKDPEQFEFVRSGYVTTRKHDGEITRGRSDMETIGYAELDPEAPYINPHPSRTYQRRIFYLKHTDSPHGGDVFQDNSPAEAVDPMTVDPGEIGQSVTP
jgi:hypothetical protein